MKKMLLVSAAVVAFANVAAAQEAVPAASGQAAADATDDGGISDIVVTASRRVENAQRAALSIQALSSEDLARANVTKPEDLNAIAPGLSIGTGGNSPQVYIRGVGNFGTNSLSEGAVAFNLDGVYIARQHTTRGMFFDLARVEVLKGPQGTLYGRNASGGAINVITNRPKLGERSGYFDLMVGNYTTIQAEAGINLPLGDTAALRVSGQSVHRDGYLSDGYDDEKTKSARVQVYWEPSSDVSILLNGNFQKVEGKGAGAPLVPQLSGADKFTGGTDPAIAAIIRAQPGIGPFLIVPQNDGFVDYTTYAVGAEFNWNLGFAKLTLIPAYRQSDLRDLTYVPGFSVYQSYREKQTSVEARLGGESSDLKWVLGGYFFDQQVDGPPGGAQQIAFQGVSTFTISDFSSNVRSYAAFGQATYSLTDRFRVTGGIRYTYERKQLSEFLTNYGLPAPPPAPNGTCAAGYFDLLSPTPPRFCHLEIDLRAGVPDLTYSNVTWKAGVEFDVAEHSMAYASASTGFKSGGFFSAPPPNTFRPEKITAFDIGIKNRFLDNRLQVNLGAFYWRYSDHQETFVGPTSIPGFVAQNTYNAGKAKSYGFDADIVFQPTPRDRFGLMVQYNKTKYDFFQYTNPTQAIGSPVTGCVVGPVTLGSQTIDCSGKPLMRAPVWTGSASYSHDFELANGGKITASADVQFSSSYYLSVDFLESARQKAFAVGNFDLTYTSRDGRFSVSGFVRNIWNEAVYTQAFHYPFVSAANPAAGPDGVILGTLRPPRTFGGRVRVTF